MEVENRITQTKELARNMYKPMITLGIVAILLVILYQIYAKIIVPKVKQSNFLLLSNKNTADITIIPSSEISPRKTDEDEEGVTVDDVIQQSKTHMIKFITKYVRDFLIFILGLSIFLFAGSKVINVAQYTKLPIFSICFILFSIVWLIRKRTQIAADLKKIKSKKNPNNLQFISDPYDQYSYTIILKIRVDDYYDNLGYWKHVLHRGTRDNDEEAWKFTSWNEVVTRLPKQNPGLWFHPAENTLRFCLNTTITSKYLNIPEHADNVSSVMRREQIRSGKKDEYTTPLERMEFIDIPNVPINRDVEYVIIVDRTNITVIKDKNNLLFTQLEGLPKINSSPIEVHRKTTYNGKINEFSLIPYPLNAKNKKNFI